MVLRARDLEGASAPYRSAAFGAQAYSKRNSEPLYSFGTGSVEARANTYLGKEFCSHQFHLAVGPGPAAHVPRAQTAPSSRINVRWGADTTTRTAPSRLGTPGLGTYRTPDSTVGQKMASAAFVNSPRYSWVHTATREKHQNMYLSPGHERELLGRCSPGPHVVGREAFGSMGVQASSLRRTMPRFAAPKAERNLRLTESDRSWVPGPASYNF